MNNFCKFCGKETVDGKCDCKEFLENQEQNLEAGEIAIADEVITPNANPLTPEVLEPVVEKTDKKEKKVKIEDPFAGTASQVGSTFASFLTHPIKTTASVDRVPFLASLFLILFHALTMLLFCILGYKNLLGSLPNIQLGVFTPFIVVFGGAVIHFLIIYLFSKLSRPTLSIKGTFGVIALSQIPWILGYLALTGLSFFMSNNNIIKLIMLFIFFFCLIFSTLIIERGVQSKVSGDARRIFIVALSASLNLTFSVIAVVLMLVKNISSY